MLNAVEVSLQNIKKSEKAKLGWKDSKSIEALALHVADVGLIPSTIYDSPGTSRSD